MNTIIMNCVILFFICLVTCEAKKIKIPQTKYECQNLSPLHPQETVMERNLVEEKVKRSRIIDEYKRYSTQVDIKHFKNPSLGFITPWNKNGYELAKIFHNKFTMLSPCWFSIARNNVGQVFIDGEQDMNKKWYESMTSICTETKKQGKNCTLIIPRFTWKVENGNNMDIFMAADTIVNMINKYSFDGLVLDLQFSERSMTLINYIKMLAKQKPSYTPLTIVVTLNPTFVSSYKFLSEMSVANTVNQKIDYMLMMSYDYSIRNNTIGPNSPRNLYLKDINSILSLLPNSIQGDIRYKTLLGIPFYGYDNYDAIVGSQVIDIIKNQNVPFKYNNNAEEHSFKYVGPHKSIHTVYYPTLKSIQDHLNTAGAQNFGIGIWELGQGLDYFFDLL